MSTTATKQLQTLHTAAIDAMNGYEEALKQADGHALTDLFEEMSRLHRGHAEQLTDEMRLAGESAGEDGSIMSTVHGVIMDIRSMFGGLDASVLPGLIDGEKRNIAKYDEVLSAGDLEGPVATLITRQKLDLSAALSRMQARSGSADPNLVL
jgi:uncharacterized protein (TIGR02284 family)